MKTIGLLGGMSWESSKEYYRLINEGVRDRLGGLHSAPLLMHSFDFAAIAEKQHAGQWDALGDMLAEAATNLQRGGAEAVMICTNLMHKPAPAVEAALDVPLLHIADAVAAQIKQNNQQTVGLLGAEFTMREGFYRERLQEKHGIDVLIPTEPEIAEVSRVVYEELCQGRFTDSARDYYLGVMDRLRTAGAEGMVLGCTEIPLLIRQDMTDLPLYDTTAIHAASAVSFIFGDTASQQRKAS